MKIIIAGGRDYKFTVNNVEELDAIEELFTEVVCGGARGADTEGKEWAVSRGIPVKMFPANWNLGKGAGHTRNTEMAKYADGVILFKGGKGTGDMYKKAKSHNLHIWDWREEQTDLSKLLT